MEIGLYSFAENTPDPLNGGHRRGSDEVRAVVLAQAIEVEADLVGQLDLLEEVAQPLPVADIPAEGLRCPAFALAAMGL